MFGSLLVLIPISIFLVVVIGISFWWAIFAGQFEDTGNAADSILLDDDSTASPAGTERPPDT
ncbi:cbb3-type cytochrome oxidase assembly protein CcoS [Alcaligenes ammonioxydans]|jgi:cbb3-type cytochrome oxidase maturation protein|uniref:Cbb3-type cytochrome oxidase assembly protein CcoS n=1 Tax=Alcaligenes ammonioxydans TaxID=2582914 RepID=A0ABX8SX61_9BURK|nr:cbb3-type cytochrome oxidase assembly protein CcoS [Alcaligenes ammonioxydans]EJC65258.1 cbb3-type cytochrome oxidase maturation protein [Alcaligenes faecalis subsp. faecalis NCIB 8687]MBX7020776.1 cbb3-type cytochrome oxidase assembly protein CcoS [Providencia rettgeri]QBH18344.1 cbb3-type cytochrome oxidase assembly protein CcoS [Alcaligenes faecalis]MCH1878108.1 cbb3-type cytochrome oxidase assembly protein CcoS [Alcaligenes ammonioxydans]QXX79498.1 cbb3-type cytochrome oxidase assembly 